MRLRDILYIMLVEDTKTQRPSHTKFWSNVGYAAMVFTFVWAVMYGTTVDIWIWALFGLVVVGNRTILKLMGYRRGDTKE